MIAATMRIATPAWRRYCRRKDGVSMPNRARAKLNIGISKTTPHARMKPSTKLKYSEIDHRFSIPWYVNPDANPSDDGTMTKYAKPTPARKQKIVATAIQLEYLRSFR